MRPFAIALLGATISCHAMTASQTPAFAATLPASQMAALARYHTFSFALPGQPPVGYDISERSLQAEERAQQAVVADLVRKGYAQESSNGEKSDFIVRLSSGTRELLSSDPETGFPPPYSEEAKVTIDLFDAANGSQVWHGVAIADADAQTIDVQVPAAVRTAIAAVPAQSPSTSSVARN
jgi:Domain of unknown function (DUF4136)